MSSEPKPRWIGWIPTELLNKIAKTDEEVSLDEISRLKAENAKLLRALQEFKLKNAMAAPPSKPGVPGGPEDVKDAVPPPSYSESESPAEYPHISKSLQAATAPATTQFDPVEKTKPEVNKTKEGVIRATDKSSLIVSVHEYDENIRQEEVAIVDLDEADWWTIVEKPKDTYVNCFTDGSSCEVDVDDDTDCKAEITDLQILQGLGGKFEMIGEEEVHEAISDFLRICLERFPETQRLGPSDMKQLVDGTFKQMHSYDRRTISKLWSWGQFLYTSYGYGKWAMRVYKEPAMARLVATCIYKAASWALVLLF